MARQHLIHPALDAHLAALRRRLPHAVVDELADDAIQTYQHRLRRQGNPAAAAAVAIADLGDVNALTVAFTRSAPGRRAALTLLATGPLVGGCWAIVLISGWAWTWPVPTPARWAFGICLLTAIATFLIAATSTAGYRRTRLAGIGAITLITLDLTLVTTVTLTATALTWPLLLAVPASAARAAWSVRALPRILTH
jgi:hypothetical protein